MKISIIPKIMGSVGRLNPNPPSIFWRLIANGVKKTTNKISLSKENKASNTTKMAAGMRLK